MTDETKPSFIPVEGVMEAPVIFFEACPTFGNNGGLINVMLAVGIVVPSEEGNVKTRVRAVAHLRMTAASAVGLRDIIDKALLIGAPVENPAGKAN